MSKKAQNQPLFCKKLQNISKNHANIAKYFKKCQKMLTFILPNLPKFPISTPQSSFSIQNQTSTSKKIPQNPLFFKNSRFQKSRLQSEFDISVVF